MLPPGYDTAIAAHPPRRYPVLYFLHGLGDNEQTLFKTGGWNLIEDLRQQGQIGDFLVVAPEGKSTFYINSADGRVRYSDFFLREFIPFIETHYSAFGENVRRAPSAAFPWEDTARLGLPSRIQNFFLGQRAERRAHYRLATGYLCRLTLGNAAHRNARRGLR